MEKHHLFNSASECYHALQSVAINRGYSVSAASGTFPDMVLVASKESHGAGCYGASRLVLTGAPYACGLWSAWF